MVRSSLAEPICVGLGICALDYILVVDKYPRLDDKINSEYSSRQGGGPVPNALCTLSRFGIKSSFIGKCGRDHDGTEIIEELKLFGVDTSHLISDPDSRTARAFIIVERHSGMRTVILDRMESSSVAPDEIPKNFIQSAQYLLLDGRDQEAARTVAMIAKKANVEVVLDAGSARRGLGDLFPYVDHLVCSANFSSNFTQEEDPGRAALKFVWTGFKSVVVTCGSKGCVGATPEGELFEQDAFKVEVMDTTGAGDVFHGAYIFGLMQGWEMQKNLEFSSAAAALKCTRIGGRHGIPELNDVYGFLKWK
jgi:sulfofructose kinase